MIHNDLHDLCQIGVILVLVLSEEKHRDSPQLLEYVRQGIFLFDIFATVSTLPLGEIVNILYPQLSKVDLSRKVGKAGVRVVLEQNIVSLFDKRLIWKRMCKIRICNPIVNIFSWGIVFSNPKWVGCMLGNKGFLFINYITIWE